MEWDTVRFETAEHDERVGFLVLDRPAVLNAVNDQLIADFKQACEAPAPRSGPARRRPQSRGTRLLFGYGPDGRRPQTP